MAKKLLKLVIVMLVVFTSIIGASQIEVKADGDGCDYPYEWTPPHCQV